MFEHLGYRVRALPAAPVALVEAVAALDAASQTFGTGSQPHFPSNEGSPSLTSFTP